MAKRVLELAASRDPAVIEAARELAAIVLGRDEVRLARRVLEGGPLALARAVDLAEMFLDSNGANVDLGARTVR